MASHGLVVRVGNRRVVVVDQVVLFEVDVSRADDFEAFEPVLFERFEGETVELAAASGEAAGGVPGAKIRKLTGEKVVEQVVAKVEDLKYHFSLFFLFFS